MIWFCLLWYDMVKDGTVLFLLWYGMKQGSMVWLNRHLHLENHSQLFLNGSSFRPQNISQAVMCTRCTDDAHSTTTSYDITDDSLILI